MNRLSLFETPLWMTELDLDLNSLENKLNYFQMKQNLKNFQTLEDIKDIIFMTKLYITQ